MAYFYFIVSDKDDQNPPRDNEDLMKRLGEIQKWIPQPPKRQRDNNMKFAKMAFTLFKDCGLITRENMEHLNNKQWCDKNIAYFELTGECVCSRMNPLGGVVRREDLPMCDKSNLRYYCPRDELKLQTDIDIASDRFGGASKLAVVCEDVTYYISNDWFSADKQIPTKVAFTAWLAMQALKIFGKIWADNENKVQSTTLDTPDNNTADQSGDEKDLERQSSGEPIGEVTIPITDELQPDKSEDLSKVIALLNSLHEKVDNITLELEEIKKLWR